MEDGWIQFFFSPSFPYSFLPSFLISLSGDCVGIIIIALVFFSKSPPPPGQRGKKSRFG